MKLIYTRTTHDFYFTVQYEYIPLISFNFCCGCSCKVIVNGGETGFLHLIACLIKLKYCSQKSHSCIVNLMFESYKKDVWLFQFLKVFYSFYVAVPRSILRPTWDWRTKPEGRDFNEFNHILQESKKLGKALENLSRSEWTDNYPVRNSNGRLIHTARTDTDRLQQTLQQVFSDQCVTPIGICRLSFSPIKHVEDGLGKSEKWRTVKWWLSPLVGICQYSVNWHLKNKLNIVICLLLEHYLYLAFLIYTFIINILK